MKRTCQRGRLARQSRIGLVFMGSVVVDDQMDVEIGRHIGFDLIEELSELDQTMPWIKSADHHACGDVERCEQGCRAMTV